MGIEGRGGDLLPQDATMRPTLWLRSEGIVKNKLEQELGEVVELFSEISIKSSTAQGQNIHQTALLIIGKVFTIF
jgi:hypothetical protein